MKTEIHIEGMQGDACAVKSREALRLTAGVHEADITFKRRTVIVDFDDAIVQESTLIKKIQDIGFTATISGQSQSEVGA